MINLIRNLRHNSFFVNSVFWKLLGNFYRGAVEIIPFDFSIKQRITDADNTYFDCTLYNFFY